MLPLLCASALIYGQEICDNGTDDDADGLIDLNDSDCRCAGIIIPGPSDVLPNGSLEDMDCCPSGFSQFDCASSWQAGNGATTDYMNTCGFILPAVYDLGLVPFPDGAGIGGMVFADSWKEYMSICLNGPLEAGSEITVNFWVACVVINNNGTLCNGGNPTWGNVDFTIYGNPTCNNLTVGGTGCPNGVDPTWVVLGTVSVPPVTAWMQVSITFTPGTDINAIMLGPPCNLPPGMGGSPCYAYYVVDGVEIVGEQILDELEIIETGLPCNFAYTLDAFVDHQGPGWWQWYYNGIAISGQTASTLPLSENDYQSGKYHAVYFTPDGCVMDSITVTIPPRDTLEVEVFFCPLTAVSCAGETYTEPGTYNVNIITPEGCDSVVTCIVTEYVLVPPTNLVIDTCGPVQIKVCNEVLEYTGYYEIICSDYRGCDSIVTMDLVVMEPLAVISPPPLLACDPLADVVLDGFFSPLNPVPSGTTTYEWTGPIDGMQSDPYNPWLIVNKTGKYCLIITFENNGKICTDTACVTVMSSAAVPSIPLIQGPAGGCPGDVLTYTIKAQGSVPKTGYTWIYPPGHDIVMTNDSTLVYTLNNPGTITLCAFTYNECGTSDTLCIPVITASTDTFFFSNTTCNPTQAGVFTSSQLNQFGCDSTVVNTVTLLPSDFNHIISTTCNPSLAGIDTLSLSNQYGCDSVVVLQVNLLPSHAFYVNALTCDSLAAGLDTLYLSNQYGCDSIIYIDRQYAGKYQEETFFTICGAGTNYIDTLIVSGGTCDSMFISSYTFIPLDTTWLSFTNCDPGQVGTTVLIVPASTGCDSTIISTTTLLPSSSTQVQAFTCDINQAGQQVFNLQNQNGCDSIVTLTTTYVGLDTIFLQATTCDLQQAGTAVNVSPGTYCDTVRVTTTTFIPGSESLRFVTLCNTYGPSRDTLVYLNSAGCDSLDIIEYVYEWLEADALVKHEGCAGNKDGAITIQNVTGAIAPIQYRIGNGNWQSLDQFNNLNPGTYNVYVRDSRGCVDTLSGLIINNGVVLTVDAGPDQVADYGTEINLAGSSNHPLSQIQWSAPDPLSCSTCLITRLGPLKDNQDVIFTGITAEGCEAQDIMKVIVRKRPLVFIPTSFSPNYDGINDIFSIYVNEFVVSIRNLAIYDRWGNSLYLREDLPINDPSVGWDGSFRGKDMDPGVYVYVVEVELYNGKIEIYKGDVTIVK